MIKIGIPRALLYYQYYPMWKTFFEGLGAEVVLSPPTTKGMLAAGAARVVAETCLPVKVYLGHVITLVDRCDYVFVPALRSIKAKVLNCSKFLGLPDMTRVVIPECPPILEIEIDISKGKSRLEQAVEGLGRRFTRSRSLIRESAMAAWHVHEQYRQFMARDGLTPPGALPRLYGETGEGKISSPGGNGKARATLAVIGHPYLLYDEYINHRLIHRLETMGNRVVTPEMLLPGQLEDAVARIGGGAYWTYEEDVVGAGGHYLENGADGIISVMAFGCGPDSVMIDTVQRRAAALRRAPFMSLTLEEHTAEAGLVTRLEAFTDMIYRRQVKSCA